MRTCEPRLDGEQGPFRPSETPLHLCRRGLPLDAGERRRSHRRRFGVSSGPYTCSHVGHIGNPRAPPTTRRPDHSPAHPATCARITPLSRARSGGASRLARPTERTRGLGRRVRRRRRRPYRAALDGSTGNRSRCGRRKRAVVPINGGGCRSTRCGVALGHRRFGTGQWNDSACTRDRCCARCRARGGSARRAE